MLLVLIQAMAAFFVVTVHQIEKCIFTSIIFVLGNKHTGYPYKNAVKWQYREIMVVKLIISGSLLYVLASNGHFSFVLANCTVYCAAHFLLFN